MILDLNEKEVELILEALDTHIESQLPDEVKADADREVAFAIVDAVKDKLETKPPVLSMTEDELHEIREALDSHRYWNLSDINYRNSGYVMDPGSDDPEYAAAIVELDKLDEKLEDMQDTSTAAALMPEAVADLESGRAVPYTELRKRLGLEKKLYTRAELLVIINVDRATRNESPWSADELNDRIETGEFDDKLLKNERSQA